MVVNIKSSNRSYDILIIGGGIIGVFCAYYARQKWPGKRIAVVEKGMISKGTTACSAYLDFPFGVTPYKQALTRRSQELFNELLGRHPELPLTNAPFVGIVNECNIQQIIKNITMPGTKIGVRSSFYNHVPVDFQLPSDSSYFCNIRGSYAYNDCTYILAMEVAKRKVAIYESTEVLRLEGNIFGYTIHTNYGLTLETSVVIDATGPWMLRGLSKTYMAKKNVRIKKVVALHVDQTPPENAPILYFFDEDAFVLPQPHFSRWLFSYRCNDWDLVVEGGEFKISETNMHDALQLLNKYNRKLSNNIIGGRVFCDLYSANGDPVIDIAGPNYIIAGAPGGSGFRLAPAMAEEVIHKIGTLL